MATLTELEQRLAAYRQAELDVLTKGQSYEIPGPDGSRRFSRASLADLQRMIQALELDISRATALGQGTPRRRVLVPYP
ncbi:MAG: hypothetical protein ACK41W_13310 [Cyanobacteriota bacterium]|jgi:hypothetical protein